MTGIPWKNQYIALTAERSDKIHSIGDEPDVESARQWVNKQLERAEQRILEIGSGSGGHLIEVALRNPRAVCLGWEQRFKRTYRTVEKAELLGAQNLFLLLGDAGLLDQVFPADSIDTVYLNFPDPWEKRRWRKNRMVQLPFLETLFRVLRKGGIFSFKTDHAQYFEQVRSLLEQSSHFAIMRCIRDLHREIDPAENIFTEFERMFITQGKAIHMLEARVL